MGDCENFNYGRGPVAEQWSERSTAQTIDWSSKGVFDHTIPLPENEHFWFPFP